MTSRIETGLRAGAIGMLLLGVIATRQEQAALARAHPADVAQPVDLAVLRANSDTVVGRTIRDSCGSIIHPVISYPAADTAVVIEADPTGQCVGSNPPSTLSILLLQGDAWRPSTSVPASSYRLGPVHADHPDIIASYAPFNRDCPVLSWDGKNYRFARRCGGGGR